MSNDVAAAVTVRQARMSDLETIVHLRLSLLREHPDHPIYGRLRADAARRAREVFASQLGSLGETMLLAEREGRVVGILRCAESVASPLLDPARYAYISSVFVERSERRSGVLRALLEAAEQWCDSRGLTDMRLHSVSGDQASEGAWEHLGFIPVETVRMKRRR